MKDEFRKGSHFDGAETNCRIAHNLGILLMNSNCFAFFFSGHYSYVCSDIYMETKKMLIFKKGKRPNNFEEFPQSLK